MRQDARKTHPTQSLSSQIGKAMKFDSRTGSGYANQPSQHETNQQSGNGTSKQAYFDKLSTGS